MDHTLHKFRPGETIDAVIRLKGRHSYTPDELVLLRAKFNEMNGMVVPRAGDTFKIPLEASILLVPVVDGPVVADPEADGQEPADH